MLKFKPFTTLNKNIVWIACSLLGCIIFLILICNLLIVSNASGKNYNNTDDIPHNKYGLLLGTSPLTQSGVHNYYFDFRIEAADKLFKAGKIDYVIVSGGDYRSSEKFGCDEPAAMRDSLLLRGVPNERIIMDYDGTRTIKSFENALKLVGAKSLTIISQEYHNYRALYIAKHLDIDAVAFNAKEPVSRNRIKNHVREYLARPKMFLDLIF